MNALHVFTQGVTRLDAAERIGWVLLQSLWQGGLVALLLAAMLAILGRASARVRYAIACAAMAGLIVLPILTAAWVLTIPQPGLNVRALDGRTHSLQLTQVAPEPLPANVTRADVAPASGTTSLLFHAIWLAWTTGVTAMSAWNLLGWFGVIPLRRVAISVPTHWQEKLHQLASAMGITWPVLLRECRRVSTPVLVGWIRPMVLVPVSALTELPAAHLEALLLHELAHVRRHDYLVNLIQTVIETLLFYHPAAWWVGRQVRREREHCCDDIAAARCGSKVEYAKALAAMEELRFGPVPALALGASDGSLLRRIERLVAPNHQRARRRVSPVAAGLLLVAAAALLVPVRKTIAVPEAERAAAPANPQSRPTGTDSVKPEDLDPGQPTDYRISPNDLLSIQISELNGPGKETRLQKRVSDGGKISMPYLDKQIQVAGLTDFELEQAIIKAYRDAGLIAHAQVSVTILEARGNAFSIIGEVNKPGEYIIQERPFRLLNALALAGGVKPDVTIVAIMRADKTERKGDTVLGSGNARVLEVPAAKLLAGDEKLNLIVRPGDTVIVGSGPPQAAAPANVVRLTIAKDSIQFDGRSLTWDEIAQSIEKLPDRANTVLELAPASDDVPVGRFFDAQSRAGALVSRLGLKRLMVIEATPPG